MVSVENHFIYEQHRTPRRLLFQQKQLKHTAVLIALMIVFESCQLAV